MESSPPSGCHSAEHIQLSDLKTRYLGKVKDLLINFWLFTQVMKEYLTYINSL